MGRFLRQLLAAVRSPAQRRFRRVGSRPEVTCLEGRQLLTLSPTNIVVVATPHTLTPVHGQYVPVTVTGSFKESAANAAPSGFFYVTDQYGKIEPRAAIPLQQSTTDPTTFDFSFTINLAPSAGA